MTQTAIRELAALLNNLSQDDDLLGVYTSIRDLLIRASSSNKFILVAGNGGSASQAQHFTAELVGRYKKKRRAIRALALHCDTSFLTAWSNDYSFDTVFSRQIEAFGQPDDILLVLSTSGCSKNILSALTAARGRRMTTVGLLGSSGGSAKDVCDFCLIVPSDKTDRVQEVHLTLLHALAQDLEDALA